MWDWVRKRMYERVGEMFGLGDNLLEVLSDRECDKRLNELKVG